MPEWMTFHNALMLMLGMVTAWAFVVVLYSLNKLHERLNNIEQNVYVTVAFLATWSMRPDGKVAYPNVQEQTAADFARDGLITRYKQNTKAP